MLSFLSQRQGVEKCNSDIYRGIQIIWQEGNSLNFFSYHLGRQSSCTKHTFVLSALLKAWSLAWCQQWDPSFGEAPRPNASQPYAVTQPDNQKLRRETDISFGSAGGLPTHYFSEWTLCKCVKKEYIQWSRRQEWYFFSICFGGFCLFCDAGVRVVECR